jgi:hypothetical protein
MSKNKNVLKGGKTTRRTSKRKSKKMSRKSKPKNMLKGGGARCDKYTHQSHIKLCKALEAATIPLDIYRILHIDNNINTIATTLPCNLTAPVNPCPEAIQIMKRAVELIKRLDDQLKTGEVNKTNFPEIETFLADKDNKRGNYYIPDGFDLRTNVIRTVKANIT